MKSEIDYRSDDTSPTASGDGASLSSRKRRRRVATRDGPEPVDVHVGTRIRLRRTLLGLSQTDLGKALGLTFQQIQKYERGSNRVAASTLHRLAHALDVPVSFFFDDLSDDLAVRPSGGRGDIWSWRESLELLRHYHRLPDTVRKPIYSLIKAMARTESDGDDGT